MKSEKKYIYIWVFIVDTYSFLKSDIRMIQFLKSFVEIG